VHELAHRAVVSIAMVDFIEETQGPSSGGFAHLAAIQATLEDAGIEFVETTGVRLRPEQQTHKQPT
jgi:hypothetical protein